MSGANIAAKVNLGLRKAAAKVGYPVKLYRPDHYFNPLDDRNFVETLMTAWSVDDGFQKNPVAELDYYKLFVPADSVQPGDFIMSEDQGKTFVVTEVQPMRAPAGILVNDRVTVLRTENTPDQDVKTQLVPYFTQLPCAVKWSSTSNNQGLSPVSTMRGGQSQVEVWTWVTPGTIRLGDVLEINDLRFVVSSCQSTSKGTKINGISTVAGK